MQASGVSAEEAIRRLREKSGGNFLWTEQALLGLEAGTHDFAHLDALPPGLTGLYTAFFERHFPDDASYAPARRVLEVVTAAREPLTPAEIAAVTGLDPDYELPPLLDRLAAYLPDRDGRRAVFHKSFADWLTETQDPRPAGRFFVSPRRGHERLADWCWAEYRRGAKKMSPYALRHLPAHLIEAARWDDLATLLRGLPFLEAKAEAGYVFDLAMDFTRAVERHARRPSGPPPSSADRAGPALRHPLPRPPPHDPVPVPLEPVLVVRLPGGRRPLRPAPWRLARRWAALEPTRGRTAVDLARILARGEGTKTPAFPGCGRSARLRFLSAAPSWPASAGTRRGQERGVRP